jgi:hypothetical protein
LDQKRIPLKNINDFVKKPDPKATMIKYWTLILNDGNEIIIAFLNREIKEEIFNRLKK